MSKKQLLRAIASAIGIAAATTVTAAPLPDGTTLTLIAGSGSGFAVECLAGTSCFGMETAPTLYFWSDINSLTTLDPDTGEVLSVTPTPGTDPGIILGKNQKSGGQELAPSAANTTAGEITGAWSFGSAFGTFYTAPGLLTDGTTTLGAAANIFGDVGCALSTCLAPATNTALKVWNVAWNGGTIPMGTQYPCIHANCSANLKLGYNIQSYTVTPSPAVDGSTWTMRFFAVVPTGGFEGFRYRMALAGVIKKPPVVVGPVGANVSITGVYASTINWAPSVSGGVTPYTCRIDTPPGNGTATVLSNCSSGTYMANMGFIGVDSFTYMPTGPVDGTPGTVSAAIIAPTPVASPTPTATFVTSPTPTATFVTSPTPTTPVGATPTATFLTSPTPTATFVKSPTPTTPIVASPTPTATVVKSPTPTPVTSPTPTPTNTPSGACIDKYPVSSVTLTGKQGHLKVVVTGNIVSSNTNGKEIKICPTSTASYVASTNTAGATVVCKVKNHTSKGKGNTKVNDHVKCSDKPVGNDKIHFKIKSGENKKWNGSSWV